MRYLITLLLAALSFSAFSQNNSIHVYPWNPDANHNNNIGADDLLPFLSVFGEEFGLPPEPCTYDGTPLEELMTGVADGTIILDSLFIEYELEDVSTYYILGCPDPITDSLIFSGTALLTNLNIYSNYWRINGYDSYGNNFIFDFYYDLVSGLYKFSIYCSSIQALGYTNDGFFSGLHYSNSNEYSIPFPSDWIYDESGISINWVGGWANYANYLHILPYWHYADE